jgi:hypothetical protein
MSYLWITKRIVKPLNNYKCFGLLKELSIEINNNNFGLIDNKYYQGMTLQDNNNVNNNIVWSCTSWDNYLNMKSWEKSNNRKKILNKYNDIIIYEEHSLMFKETDDTFLL